MKSSKPSNSRQYDLEERTLTFAKKVNRFANSLPKTITNLENAKQLVRAVGSVGANYIEANESLSAKDFLMRIKISKKEAKEARYWLQLIETKINEELKNNLINEATELMKILGAISEKAKDKVKFSVV